MKAFRKKQKRFNRMMKGVVIFTAVFLFAFIGAEPYVEQMSAAAANGLNTLCDCLVILSVVLLFFYYGRYSKCDSFLESVEYEISDWGYYYTKRREESPREMAAGILGDIKKDGYAVTSKPQIGKFQFEFSAFRKNEFFYCAAAPKAGREYVAAQLDAAINDVTVNHLKRKGALVLCIVTDCAEDSAVGISKMTVPIGKKEQMKANLAIVEAGSKKCYFLGNRLSKCQQMILSYVMKCQSPMEPALFGERQLDFQRRLEAHMESFNLKDFKDGRFSAHQ